MTSKKILTSKQEIMSYVGNASDYLFKKYIALGMPARFEDSRWFAHVDNIEEWFKQYTRVSMRKMLANIPDETHVKQNNPQITTQ
jgi:hypothetical protein